MPLDTIAAARRDYNESRRSKVDWAMYVARVDAIRSRPVPEAAAIEAADRAARIADQTYRLHLGDYSVPRPVLEAERQTAIRAHVLAAHLHKIGS